MGPHVSPEQLQRLLAEQLGAAERQAVEVHIDGCEQCQTELTRLGDAAGAGAVDWKKLGPTPPEQAGPLPAFLDKLKRTPPAAAQHTPASSDGECTCAIHFPEPPTARGPLGRLESYHIVRELGHGAFGSVFLAYDDKLACDVALKVLRPDAAASASDRARFEREARSAAAVHHVYVVPIYHVGSTPGFALPYFVMEYVDGETLAARLERTGPLGPRAAAAVVRQAALGLAAAHDRGLVHRDIKPSNLLLERETGRAKVTDFGLARTVDVGREKLTQSGAIVGTPQYLSPEQIQTPERIDQRSDVYALGVVLYEALTGEPPFRGVTHMILQQIVFDEPRPPRQLNDAVPRDLETICLKCLQKEPAKRYASAEPLAEDLRRWLNGEPIQARPVSRIERVWRWCRRKPLPAGLAAAVVLAVLTTVVLSVSVAVVSEQGRRAVAAERDEKEKQREKAVAAHDEALKVVELVSSVGQLQVLEKQKELTPQQMRLLKALLTYYQRYVQEEAIEEQERARQAQGYFNIGWLQARLGYRDEAMAAWRKTQEQYEQLVAEFPSVSQYRQQLASSRTSFGVLLEDLGKHVAAEAEHRQAVAVLQQLVAEFPTVPEYRQELASSRTNLGALLENLGKHTEAEAEYHQAVAVLQQLVANFPTVPKYRQRLASSRNNLGALLADLGKRARAEAEYRKALVGLQQLVAEFPTVPEYRQELARSRTNLGILLHDLGKHVAAEAEHRQAVAVLQQLVAEFPTVPEYRQELASSCNNLGALLTDLGKRAVAEAEYRQAVAVLQRLVAEFPTVPEYCQQLATTRTNLAVLLEDLGKRAEAEAEYHQAVAVLQQLVANFPTVPKYRQGLAGSRNNLGALLATLGKRPAAEAEFRQAVAAYQQLVADFPTVPDYVVELGCGYSNVGNLARENGRPTESLDWFGKAIITLGPVLEKEPRLVTARRFLRNSYRGRAVSLDQLTRPAEALQDWQRAVELDDQRIPSIHLGFAAALARTGQKVQAVVIVEELTKDMKLTSDTLHDCARVFALVSAAAKEDSALQEQYAARAITLLRQAHVAGYFKDTLPIVALKQHADWAALHTHTGFKELLLDLEGK